MNVTDVHPRFPEVPVSGNAWVIRSNAYVLTPGFPCPGVLEASPTRVLFEPNESVWILGGFGGARGVDIPLTCVAGARISSVLGGAVRGWPGRTLRLELGSGRKVVFGVPRPETWVHAMVPQSTAVRACPAAERALRSSTWTAIADFAVTGTAVAVGLVALERYGDVTGYGLLGVFLAARFVTRFRWSRARETRAVRERVE